MQKDHHKSFARFASDGMMRELAGLTPVPGAGDARWACCCWPAGAGRASSHIVTRTTFRIGAACKMKDNIHEYSNNYATRENEFHIPLQTSLSYITIPVVHTRDRGLLAQVVRRWHD